MKPTTSEIEWHPYPKEKPPEKTTYFLTVNFGDKEYCTDSTVYDPARDVFVGYGDTSWVKAWTDYPGVYKVDDIGEWNVYPDSLPDEDTVCFITCEDTRNGNRFVCENVYCDGFGVDCLSHYKVLAWMCTPRPYRR